MIEDIAERTRQAEKGLVPPIGIFPEGATTNGESLLQFKRGAFASLLAVKPFYSKTWTLTGVSMGSTDGISLFAYVCSLFSCGIASFILYEMPVFRPNEFFWQNHWDGKEDKWVAYARAVRIVMAEAGNFKLSDSTMEDKVVFKDLVRGKKPKQNVKKD